MCPGKLSPKRDSTTQAPRTILRKAMLCITTCAMRHSADHRHSCLPLLVRQRAHIDHSNTYHIYHNILRFVNAKSNILCLREGSTLNLALLKQKPCATGLAQLAAQGVFAISLILLQWQSDCPVGRCLNFLQRPKARLPLWG